MRVVAKWLTAVVTTFVVSVSVAGMPNQGGGGPDSLEAFRRMLLGDAIDVIMHRLEDVGSFIDGTMGKDFKLRPLTAREDRVLCARLAILFGESENMYQLTVESGDVRLSSLGRVVLLNSMILMGYCGLQPQDLLASETLPEVLGKGNKLKMINMRDIGQLDLELQKMPDLLTAVARSLGSPDEPPPKPQERKI